MKLTRKILAATVSAVMLAACFQPYNVFAGASTETIGNDSYQDALNTSVWSNPDADVIAENGKIVFLAESTKYTRLITMSVVEKAESAKELVHVTYKQKITSMPEGGRFILAFGLGSSESMSGDAGQVEVAFIKNSGMQVAIDSYETAGEAVSVVAAKSVGFSGTATIDVVVKNDKTIEVKVNGQTVASGKLGFDPVGSVGFFQTGECAVTLSNLSIKSYRYDSPENSNFTEKFDDGSYNTNLLFSTAHAANFSPSTMSVEEYEGEYMMVYENSGLAQIGTRQQYSNFELSFDVPFMFDLYRDHPGFAGVYGHDEPHSADYSTRSDWQNATVTMGKYQEASRLLSTTYDITCYENLLPYWENAATYSGNSAAEGYQAYLQDYIDRYDPHHLSFDYYLFGVTEGWWIFTQDRDVDKSAEFMQNLAMVRNAAKDAGIPFWSFVQAGANWNDTKEWMKATTNDTPSQGQMNWHANIALSYGAQGIEYFPMIQPHYYAATSGKTMDYDRNGLIGADGSTTRWYDYAVSLNAQIAAVDHVLMNAEHKGIIPVSGYAASQNNASTLNALGDENLVISKYGKLTGVTAGDTTYGVVVGCFDYHGKDAFYVTSYDVENAQTVTLNFSESVSADVIINAATTQKSGSSMSFTLGAGEGALVVLK